MSVPSMAIRLLASAAAVTVLMPSEALDPSSNVAAHGLMRREAETMAYDRIGNGAEARSANSLLEKDARGQKALTLAGTCCGREEAAVEKLKSLPKIDEFRRLWTGKMELDRAEPSFKERVRNDVKMVVGVMSFAKEDETRKIIRETWMNQPGVCIAANGPKEDCALYIVFVVGGKHKQSADYDSTDIMHVDQDVPNIFKIKTFLHRVIGEFPWATHYGKMDTDTFPHVHKLLPKIPKANSTCDVFFGATIPSHGCGLTVISDESKYSRRKYACMHGSLYLFSRKLAEGMLQKGGVVDDWFSGKHQDIDSEDLNLGIALTTYVRQTKMCLNIAEAFLPDDPGGLWDHCGVNCKGVTGHGSFR